MDTNRTYIDDWNTIFRRIPKEINDHTYKIMCDSNYFVDLDSYATLKSKLSVLMKDIGEFDYINHATGDQTVLNAIILSKKYLGIDTIFIAKEAFHGITLKTFREQILNFKDISIIEFEMNNLEDVVNNGNTNTLLILEPFLFFSEQGYSSIRKIQTAVAIAKQHGMKVLFDEIRSGAFSTGSFLFTQKCMPVDVDFLCFSKGLALGVPTAVLAIKSGILSQNIIKKEDRLKSCNDSYSLYYDYTKPMIEIMSDLGIMFKPGILEDNFDEQILSCIKARRVVMLHVDCYYLPYCKEKYQKEHFEHVITLIGYDNLSQEFDIIDQENLSSVSFGYHKAHLDDVRIAAYEEIVNRETFDNMDFVSFSQFRKWEDTNQECLEESQFNYVIDKTIEYIENNVTDIVHVLQLLLNYIKIEKSVFQYMLDDNTVQYLQKKEVQIMRFMMKIVAHKKNDGKILEDLVHVLKNWDRLL